MRSPAARRAAVVERAAQHAIAWLALAAGVGWWMAALLVAPEWNAALGPLTYGRWAPLHLDFMLYGWTGLPLVALLLVAYLPEEGVGRCAPWAVDAWSASLLLGGISWLAGGSSGRPFLDWRGAPRVAFLAALGVLALALALGVARRWALAGSAAQRRAAIRLALAWPLLAAVIPLLAWVSRPEVYPPVDPSTGGPTGASLLASSFAVFAVALLVPELLALPWRGRRWARRAPWALLAAHAAAWSTMPHGDRPHGDPRQLLAVASVALWLPLLAVHGRGYAWPATTRRWRRTAFVWAALLVVTAVAAFAPGALERAKFTDLLVAHAHLAMAGMTTAVVAVVLLVAAPEAARGLAKPWPFALWQGGTVLMLAVLGFAGGLEVAHPGLGFRPDPRLAALYAARWAAGTAMLVAAGAWLVDALRAPVAGSAA
jgi:cytochrome c oxidase cbb3-type subunit 1